MNGNLEGQTCDQIIQELPSVETKPYWGNHFWSRGYLSTQLV